MWTVTIANQKGGCGKTTTAINIAAALASRQNRILLVDLDPQSHATIGCGNNPDSSNKTIYNALTDPRVPMSLVIKDTLIEFLDLVPSNILLASAELELRHVLGKELVLSEKLRAVEDDYDLCIIDCGPSLGLLMINAFVASTGIIVPVQTHFYALDGLRRLLQTVRMVRERFYPCSVRPLGLLLTFVEIKTRLSRRVEEGVRKLFGDLVFDTVIHRSICLAEAPSTGKPILVYAPQSRAAVEYMSAAEEILDRLLLQQMADFETPINQASERRSVRL
jgi:chromosome partitioning protein